MMVVLDNQVVQVLGGGHSQKQGGNATQPTQLLIVVVMDLVTQVGKDITGPPIAQGGGGGGARQWRQ